MMQTYKRKIVCKVHQHAGASFLLATTRQSVHIQSIAERWNETLPSLIFKAILNIAIESEPEHLIFQH